MMRWIGFDFDQIGLEHMVARITGMRNSGQMNVQNTPTTGTVAKDSVLWLETGHPRFHELNVTWRIGGPTGPVIATGNSRNLDLEPLNLPAGHRRARRGPRPGRPGRHRLGAQPVDQQHRDGLRLQRLALRADAHVDGRRHDRDAVARRRRTSPRPRANTHPVAADEVVYVETNHPADRVLPVTWTLNGAAVPNPANSRNLDLGALNLPAGTHTLTAKVTDGALSDTVEWKIDKVAADRAAARCPRR